VRAGDKIYPDEVEDVLCAHAKVRQAAVVGMPDPAHEEVPVAFVVAEPKTLEARELARFCVERLAAFKVPRAFHFVSELPTNLNGKVQRAELRRRLQAGSAR
jgi:acyl-coenzyme A synthetase/AMP-(fatty) acid ligase